MNRPINLGRSRPRGVAHRCHPDRPHFAKGYCLVCYWRNRRSLRRAVCHPDRPYEARGLCHACYRRERLRTRRAAYVAALSAGRDLLEATSVRIADFNPVPQRINGLVQHVFEALPDECPKCHSRLLAEIPRGVECHLGCGWTGYLVRPGFAAVTTEAGRANRSPRV